MLNLTKPVDLNEKQKEIISGFGELTAEHWKRNETRLRKAITKDLIRLQHAKCVYCGCQIQNPDLITNYQEGDVEHIADKSTHPQFVFTPLNLAFCCKFCNQTCKGQKNVVTYCDADYSKCKFKIVHPYLDDVSEYFITDKPLIQIRDGLSPDKLQKANYTADLFQWSSPMVTWKRSKDIMAACYADMNNTSISEASIQNIIEYPCNTKSQSHETGA